MTDSRQHPIFVVGAPRSGTTLLAGLLSTHSGLICGPETEFFTGFGPVNRRNSLCRAATWPGAAADYLFSLVHEKPIPEYYGITRDEIIAYLKQRERSPQAILESLTETYMKRHGKRRWIEKTPTHTRFVHDIRRYYPEAPIIRIVRDPRDVAQSLLKVPWGPTSFAAAILLWYSCTEPGKRFFDLDRNCLTIRFEDVVLDPEKELRKICRLIGEEFEPDMLDMSRSVDHVNPTRISWKQKAGDKIDASRTAVWRREITTEQQRQAEALVGDSLKVFGYPTSFEFSQYVDALNLGFLGYFPTLLNHFLDGDTRFWKAESGESPTLRIFVGDPYTGGWIGRSRRERLAKAGRIGIAAVCALTTGPPLVWLGAPPPDEIRTWAPLPRIIAGLLPRRPDLDTFCAGQLHQKQNVENPCQSS